MLLNLGEAASKLGISYPTLRKHAETMQPQPIKVGKRFLFYAKDIPAMQAHLKKVLPPDSPSQKAWATRRKGEKKKSPNNNNIVLNAYLDSLKPGATAGIKAKATRLLNALCEKQAALGKNPTMVRAGIKAQAARILNKN